MRLVNLSSPELSPTYTVIKHVDVTIIWLIQEFAPTHNYIPVISGIIITSCDLGRCTNKTAMVVQSVDGVSRNTPWLVDSKNNVFGYKSNLFYFPNPHTGPIPFHATTLLPFIVPARPDSRAWIQWMVLLYIHNSIHKHQIIPRTTAAPVEKLPERLN